MAIADSVCMNLESACSSGEFFKVLFIDLATLLLTYSKICVSESVKQSEYLDTCNP